MQQTPELVVLSLAARVPRGRVWVHAIRNYFDPAGSRRTESRDFRPGLRVRDLLPASEPWDLESLGIILGASPARGAEALDLEVEDGQHVTFVALPAGAALPALGKVLLYAAAAAALSYAANRLISAPQQAREPENDASSTYGWSGVRTDYAANGKPIPLVFGRHRVGGVAIESYVEVIDGPKPIEFLYILLVLSAGPIHSIGFRDDLTADADFLTGTALPEGLEIGGNPAKFLDGVTAWYRSGTLDQETIPPFNAIRVLHDVGLLIDQETTASGNPPVTDWSMAAVWDMPGGVVADEVTLGLFFTAGLYRASGGSVVEESVEFEIRVTELDAIGLPTGPSYIPHPEGEPTTVVSARVQSPFTKQVVVPMFDPATYIPPTAGVSASFLSSSFFRGTISSPLLGTIALGTVGALSADSTFVWTSFKSVNPPPGHRECLWDWRDGSSRGIKVVLQRQSVFNGFRLETSWGNGSIVDTINLDLAMAVGWHQIVLAMTDLGSSFRLSWYIDGVLAQSFIRTISWAVPSVDLSVGAARTPVGGGAFFEYFDGRVDDFRFYERELDAADVSQIWNAGAPLAPVANDANLIVACPFSNPAVNIYPDLSGNGNTLAMSPTFANVLPGITLDPESGTVKRARYRIEVQRLNTVDDTFDVKDVVQLATATTRINEEVNNAGLALLGLRIEATDQLNSRRPDVTLPIAGIANLPIWDGVNPQNPTFVPGFSEAPAWHLAFLLTDEIYGGGHLAGSDRIDVESFAAWEAFTEERVYDQRGQFTATRVEYNGPSGNFPNGSIVVTIAESRPAHFHGFGGAFLRFRPNAGAQVAGYVDTVYEIQNVILPVGGGSRFEGDWPQGVPPPLVDPYTTGNNVGTLYGAEKRIRSNLVLGDRGVQFWDAVQTFCAIGRASPVLLGDLFRVKFEAPGRQPVAVITPGNMVGGGWRMSSGSSRGQYNSVVGEIQDEELDYERQPVTVDHESIKGTSSSAKVRRTTLDLRGVTSFSQAVRELTYRVNVNAAAPSYLEVDNPLDAAFVEVGDLVAVAHPLPAWGFGGRLGQDSASDTEIRCDVDVTFEAGENYFAAVVNATTGALSIVPIDGSEIPGTKTAGQAVALASSLGFTPQAGWLYAVGTFEFAGMTMKVLSSALRQEMRTRLTMVEHSDEVFPDEEGFPVIESSVAGPTGPEPIDRQELGRRIPLPSAGLAVREIALQDQDGSLRSGLFVSWTWAEGQARFVGSTRIWLRETSRPGSEATLYATLGSRELEVAVEDIPLARASTWSVAVQPVSLQGDAPALTRCSTRSVEILALYSLPPAGASPTIEANGEAVTYRLELPEAFENTVVTVLRGGTFVGTAVGRIPVGSEHLGPTRDWLLAAGPNGAGLRTPRIVFRAGMQTGLLGHVADLPSDGSSDFILDDGFPAAAISYNPEDASHGGWGGDGSILTGLMSTNRGDGTYELTFSTVMPLPLSGMWISKVFDLGEAKRWHVGFGIEGDQIHPGTILGISILDYSALDPRVASWTPQGPLDPNDPEYRKVRVELFWSTSLSTTPATIPDRAFRPGVSFFRSCRVMVKVTRPATDTDVQIYLAPLAIRELPPHGEALFVDGGAF